MCCNLLTDRELQQYDEILKDHNEFTKELSSWDKKIISLIESNLNKRQIKNCIKDDVISANPTATKKEVLQQINSIARIILLRREYQK